MQIKREKELLLLNQDYEKAASSFVFVFGVYGIGKTTLLNEYSSDKLCLHLSFIEMLDELYFEDITSYVYNFFSVKSNKSLKNFDDLLNLIIHMKIEKKIVIVFDNFQKTKFSNLKSFYSLWNKKLKHKNIQVIFSTAVHESKKEYQNIYSKASLNIILEEFTFNVISLINKNIPKHDLINVYASFGTNTLLLEAYDGRVDFISNIKNILFNKNNSSYNYGINLLKNELSDICTYTAILYAISKGNNKIGEIASYINLKSSFLTRYIQKLQDLMLIKKNIPINDNPQKSKFGRYDICDNYLKFWFSYIYPSMFFLEQNNTDEIISSIKKDFSTTLVKNAYKKYMLNEVKEKSENYFDYKPNFIDSWWNNKKEEIDIVAYDSTKVTFIDCQWKKEDSIDDCFVKLKTKALLFESPLIKEYMIFDNN